MRKHVWVGLRSEEIRGWFWEEKKKVAQPGETENNTWGEDRQEINMKKKKGA